MPFGTITTQTLTYDPRSPGKYIRSTVNYGQPTNEFFISGSRVGKDKKIRYSFGRVLEKDVVVNGVTLREGTVVTIAVQSTPNFTTTEIDSLITDCSEFATVATLSRMAQNEI